MMIYICMITYNYIYIYSIIYIYLYTIYILYIYIYIIYIYIYKFKRPLHQHPNFVILFYPDYHCHNTQKYFRLTQSNTDTNNNKFWKMGTVVEFRLLVLESLKYSSKAESPINRSAKSVISRNLTTSRHNHLFMFFPIFLSFSVFFNFVFCF